LPCWAISTRYEGEEEFDAIIMDVQMPELDGLETTAAIREAEKETGGHIPIVALTARAMMTISPSPFIPPICWRYWPGTCHITLSKQSARISRANPRRRRNPGAKLNRASSPREAPFHLIPPTGLTVSRKCIFSTGFCFPRLLSRHGPTRWDFG